VSRHDHVGALQDLLVGPIGAGLGHLHPLDHERAYALRPTGWLRVAAPIGVFTALGVVAIAYPEVLGNGRGVLQLALEGRLAVGAMTFALWRS